MDPTWRLTIGQDTRGGILVLSVGGRLGSESSGRLLEALAAALRAGERQILVDLQGVDYVSSAGIRALAAAAARVHAAGGRLVLCAVTEPVRIVLAMGGLLADVPAEPTLDAGVGRLLSSPPTNLDAADR